MTIVESVRRGPSLMTSLRTVGKVAFTLRMQVDKAASSAFTSRMQVDKAASSAGEGSWERGVVVGQ